jgi:hypothetical protein
MHINQKSPGVGKLIRICVVGAIHIRNFHPDFDAIATPILSGKFIMMSAAVKFSPAK